MSPASQAALYEVYMAVATLAITGLWMSGALKFHSKFSEAAFLIVGMGVPLMQTLVGAFLPELYWVSPVSLGAFALYAHFVDDAIAAADARRRRDELAGAEAGLRQDPSNATAHWHKGELLEADGRFDEALACYRRAHALKTRGYRDGDLTEAEERIAWAREKAGPEAERWSPRSDNALANAALKLASLDLSWIVAPLLTAPLLYVDGKRFVSALSVWLFALWCMRTRKVS